jgi:excisionase family DNA binding protein
MAFVDGGRDRRVHPMTSAGYPGRVETIGDDLVPFLSRSAVAELLNLSERTVDRLLAARELDGKKVGARVIIDPRSVRAYIERAPMVGRSKVE